MRLCFISQYDGRLDEGMGNIAFHLCHELSQNHNVLHLKIVPYMPPAATFWQKIAEFQPQIIHLIAGPSIRGLLLLKIFKLLHHNIKTVASTPQPNFSVFEKRFIPLFKPDLVLFQSHESEMLFANYGCRTRFLMNGVDIEKFSPAAESVKQELRNKYQVSAEKFVVLHVGPVKKNRNMMLLNKLSQDRNTQVIIAGGITSGEDLEVHRDLEAGGCLVLRKYFEHVEELYALSDCYIFPTMDKIGCIEIPLSVLEAMACNLPVVSTRYGALPMVFAEGAGLWYAKKEEEFVHLLNKVKAGIEVKTREKVLLYSWKNVAGKLETIYAEILDK